MSPYATDTRTVTIRCEASSGSDVNKSVRFVREFPSLCSLVFCATVCRYLSSWPFLLHSERSSAAALRCDVCLDLALH